MKRTEIKKIYTDIDAYSGKTVTVAGWARTIRDSKAFGFIELNDGSFFKNSQIVFEREQIDNYDEIARQNVGASLIVTGVVVATPEMKQPFEIKATEIKVEGTSSPDYPLQKKRHSLEYLREIAYLRPRTNTFSAVFRIRSEAAYAIHSFFHERGFVYVHTPLITGSDCEGAGAMFQVTTLDLNKVAESGKVDYGKDFFEKTAALTVSGQLNVETYAMAFSNVYTFGPTFRAERSNTPWHAAEFWMIEPEMAFADLSDDMDVAEAMVKYVINYVLEHCREELEFLNNFVDKDKALLDRLHNVVDNEFVRLTYTEAINILEPIKDRFEFPVFWGCDLQSEHERYLTETVYKKPVFLTDYPKEIKAFYMKLNADGKTVAAADLLVPGIGELIGGSQREDDLELLEKRMDELKMKKEDYWWYLNLRKYGSVTHSGFGLGFERMIMYLTGITNIRDVIPFPRTVANLEY